MIWKQHLYRCCVIFIALLHLLGGISFSVNNQVNCTQTRSGTTANFFIVTLTQATHPPPITKKKSFPFLHALKAESPALPKNSLWRRVPQRESGRAVCRKGLTSQKIAMLNYIAPIQHNKWDSHSGLLSDRRRRGKLHRQSLCTWFCS